RVHQQGSRQGARSPDAGLLQAHPVARRTGRRNQGRLLPRARLHREGRAGEDPVVAVNTGTLAAGGPGYEARPLAVSRARTSPRIVVDRGAPRLVVVGGIVIIGCILAILFVIAAEVYPLLKPPTVAFVGSYGTAGAEHSLAPGQAIGVDEYREMAYVLTAGGSLEFLALRGGPAAPPVAGSGLEGARVTAVASAGKSRLVVGTSDGRSLPLDVKFDLAFKDGKRVVSAAPTFGEATPLDPDRKRAVLRLATSGGEGGGVTVAQV